MPDMLSCVKAIADEAEGENVLIVTHGDGVNASVTRIWPWAIAHPVLHTGFTVAMREREDGMSCHTYCTGWPRASRLAYCFDQCIEPLDSCLKGSC